MQNPMNVRDLCDMYDVCAATMRGVLCRSEFARFDLGRLKLKRGPHAAQYFNVTSEFDKLMKIHLKPVYRRRADRLKLKDAEQ